jgi:putative ABC transport system permease protein
MLSNYLKLAWKVLGRRKFFTFVSLFGIALTLMVLVVAVAVVDQIIGAQAPEVNQDRMLVVRHVRLSGKGTSSGANVGPLVVSDYLRDLSGVEMIAYYNNGGDVRSQGQGSVYNIKLTDGAYWRILRFDFLEGGPFDEDDVRSRRMVAVISRRSADRAFGPGPALGKTLELEGQNFRVVGVVKDVPPLRKLGHADVWVPLTTEKGAAPRPELLGGGTAVLLMQSRAVIPAAKAAFRERIAHFQSPNPRRWTRMVAPLETRFESEAREVFGKEADDREDYSTALAGVLVLIAAAFMLLPALNLVNLNMSRILERAAEIGVRKSFGATGRTLVLQFLVENLVLTLLGAALGLVLAVFVLRNLGETDLLPHAQLQLNARVAAVVGLLTVLFGVVSGIYPAWRMSRLHPVQALKGGGR